MSKPPPIKIQPVQTAYQQVAEQLRSMILSGELTAGQRLPSEAELSESFKTSRGSIREALRLLASQSLIQTRPGGGGGSIVTLPRIDDIDRYLTTTLTLLAGASEVTTRELLDARRILEVPVARIAAQVATSEQVDELSAFLARDSNIPREELFTLNRGFHQHLIKIAGNRLLYAMAMPIYNTIHSRFTRHNAENAPWDELLEQHAQIVDALRRNDPETAGEVMLAHLMRMSDTYDLIEAIEVN